MENNVIESYKDEDIFEMMFKGEISKNRNLDFFKTKRGENIYEQVKLLKGIISDIRKGAKVISLEKKENSYIIKLEIKELSYLRTVVLNSIQYNFFKIEQNKNPGGI